MRVRRSTLRRARPAASASGPCSARTLAKRVYGAIARGYAVRLGSPYNLTQGDGGVPCLFGAPCSVILRHYIDIERGDLYRALGRYNGSLGKPEYPNMVRAAWEKQWAWRK